MKRGVHLLSIVFLLTLNLACTRHAVSFARLQSNEAPLETAPPINPADPSGDQPQTSEENTPNKPGPLFSVAPVSAMEGDVLRFQLVLSAALDHDVTVDYNLGSDISEADSANLGNNNFHIDAGYGDQFSYTLKKGSTTLEIVIPTYDDTLVEGDESFFIDVYVRSEGVGLRASGTIIDDDLFQVTDTQAVEGGEMTFHVQLAKPLDHDIYVTYNLGSKILEPDSANLANNNFQIDAGDSGQFTYAIPAGANSVDITIPTFQDTLVEGDEYLFIDVRIPEFNQTRRGIGTIIDND